jgi:hypothetical protein
MTSLTFQTSPHVVFATNTFHNVPIILQVDDTPLISVVRNEQLAYETEIPIYHSDGTYLAKVRGTRIFPTELGRKAGLELRRLQGVTVCELAGRTAFEVVHAQGDAFRIHAELHTPTGYFVKCAEGASLLQSANQPLQLGTLTMSGNMFVGCRIGVWMRGDGCVSIGVA